MSRTLKPACGQYSVLSGKKSVVSSKQYHTVGVGGGFGLGVGVGVGVGVGLGVGSGSGVWGTVTSKMRPSMMTAQGSSSWASSALRGAAAMWLSASPGSAAWDAPGCSLGHK